MKYWTKKTVCKKFWHWTKLPILIQKTLGIVYTFPYRRDNRSYFITLRCVCQMSIINLMVWSTLLFLLLWTWIYLENNKALFWFRIGKRICVLYCFVWIVVQQDLSLDFYLLHLQTLVVNQNHRKIYTVLRQFVKGNISSHI